MLEFQQNDRVNYIGSKLASEFHAKNIKVLVICSRVGRTTNTYVVSPETETGTGEDAYVVSGHSLKLAPNKVKKEDKEVSLFVEKKEPEVSSKLRRKVIE